VKVPDRVLSAVCGLVGLAVGLTFLFSPYMTNPHFCLQSPWDPGKPFRIVLSFDTTVGTLTGNPAPWSLPRDFKRGGSLSLSGYSGQGDLILKLRDPDGMYLIDAWLQDSWFSYQPSERSDLIFDRLGIYELLMESPSGSPGFEVLMCCSWVYPIWPWQHDWPGGWAIQMCLIWVVVSTMVACISILAKPRSLIPLGTGGLLACLGITTMFVFLASDTPHWYWREYLFSKWKANLPVLYICSMAFTFIGSMQIGRGVARREKPEEKYGFPGRCLGAFLILVGFLVSLNGILLYYLYDWIYEYHGTNFLVATVVWLLAGFLWGLGVRKQTAR